MAAGDVKLAPPWVAPTLSKWEMGRRPWMFEGYMRRGTSEDEVLQILTYEPMPRTAKSESMPAVMHRMKHTPPPELAAILKTPWPKELNPPVSEGSVWRELLARWHR